MDFYNLLLTNSELLIPEIFFLVTIVGLIFYGSLVTSNSYILTHYTNKISLCLVGIIFILTLNTYSLNYKNP